MLRLLNFSFNGDIRYIESTVIFVLDELKHIAPKMINLGLPKSVKHYINNIKWLLTALTKIGRMKTDSVLI